MRVIDAIWEKKNLGIATLEILIDDFDYSKSENSLIDEMKSIIGNNRYRYIVVKFKPGHANLLYIVNILGFSFIELQFELSLDKNKFNAENYSYLERHCDLIVKETSDSKDFDIVIENLKYNLFETDRISFDSKFGKDVSNKRYKGWVESLKGNNLYNLYLAYQGKHLVGFQVNKMNDSICEPVLGSLVNDYKNKGIGLMFYFALLKHTFQKYNSVHTFISSNNISVFKLWEYFGVTIKGMQYVYIKHI